MDISALLLPLGQPLPAPAVLRAAQLDQALTLSVRDAALQQALALDEPHPVATPLNPGISGLPFAWRPDGKVLAVINQHNGVTVRASMSGQVVQSVGFIELPPEVLGPIGVPGSLSTPLWSPDGQWLLLPSLALLDMSGLHV